MDMGAAAALTTRLDRLERDNRRLRVVTAVALAAALNALALATWARLDSQPAASAQGVPPVVRAERFVLTDRYGNERGELGIQVSGGRISPVLTLRDDAGSVVFGVALLDGGPFVFLNGPVQPGPRVKYGEMEAERRAVLSMGFSTGPAGSLPYLTGYDEVGGQRWSVDAWQR